MKKLLAILMALSLAACAGYFEEIKVMGPDAQSGQDADSGGASE